MIPKFPSDEEKQAIVQKLFPLPLKTDIVIPNNPRMVKEVITFKEEDIIKEIKSLRNGKAAGISGLSP